MQLSKNQNPYSVASNLFMTILALLKMLSCDEIQTKISTFFDHFQIKNASKVNHFQSKNHENRVISKPKRG